MNEGSSSGKGAVQTLPEKCLDWKSRSPSAALRGRYDSMHSLVIACRGWYRYDGGTSEQDIGSDMPYRSRTLSPRVRGHSVPSQEALTAIDRKGRMIERAPAAKRLPPVRAADLSSPIHVMNTALLGSVLATVRSTSVVAQYTTNR